MRVVLDTNTLVSGVISPGGPPRRLLDDLRAHVFELCSSATLLAELLDVLSREKFAARLTQAGLTPQGIVVELRRLAYMAASQEVPRVIEHDADRAAARETSFFSSVFGHGPESPELRYACAEFWRTSGDQ